MSERDIEYMEEVIEKLQDIDMTYEKYIPTEYIDAIREIWCDMKSTIEIKQDDEYSVEEPSYGYSYEQYLREVR